MTRNKWSILAATVCSLGLTIPLAGQTPAANPGTAAPAASTSTATTAKNQAVSTKKTKKTKKAKSNKTKKASAMNQNPAKTEAAVQSSWPAETLSAKIDMVVPDRNLVVLETPDQVTYDVLVTPKTKIDSGDQTLSIAQLAQDKNKTVSVNFTPERRGDVARSIQLAG